MGEHERQRYSARLLDPRWKARRKEIIQKRDGRCERCGENQLRLHVHHKRYIGGLLPWEYEDAELECLCSRCHWKHHTLESPLGEELHWLYATVASHWGNMPPFFAKREGKDR